MTKTELLAKLVATYKSVSTPVLANPNIKYDGGKWYEVGVLEVEDDGALYRSVQFYVINEGQANEEAYFKKDQVDKALWSKSVEEPIP